MIYWVSGGTGLYLWGFGAPAFIYWGAGGWASTYWGAGYTPLFFGVGDTSLYFLGFRGRGFYLLGCTAPTFICWGAGGTWTLFIGVWGYRPLFIGVLRAQPLMGVQGTRLLFIGVGRTLLGYGGTGLYLLGCGDSDPYLLGWEHCPVLIGVQRAQAFTYWGGGTSLYLLGCVAAGAVQGHFLGFWHRHLEGCRATRAFLGVHRAWGRAAQAFIGAQGSGGGLRRGCQVGCVAGTFLGWRTAADSGDIYRGAKQHKGGAAWSPPPALG